MKYLFIVCTFSGMLFACEKAGEKNYDETLTETIQVKSIAMETIYQLTNLHIVNSQNSSYYVDHCINSVSDTIGSSVYDTVTFDPDSQCPYLLTGNSSGGYTSVYDTPAAIADPVIIRLKDFKTNGYSISGNIHYTFSSQNHATVTVSDFIVKNEKGATQIAAFFDLTILLDNNRLTGTINGTGDFPFTWNSLTDLLADNDHSTYNFYGNFLIHTGTGKLTAGEKSLSENYGNGQEDDLVIFEDSEMDRRVCVLPRL